MSPTTHPTPPRGKGGRRRARIVVAGAVALAALGLGLLALPDAQDEPEGSLDLSGKQPARSDVTLVQANIPMRLSVTKFRADRDKVIAQVPDVITYNEVTGRDDEQLAPAGYDLFRSEKNWYTKAVAVAWRSDVWTKIDSGTKRISNFRKIPPGKRTRLGLRFVNWVTLESADGRRISVVAAHLAPPLRMGKGRVVDLSRPSVEKLGALVAQLTPAGPVLVGGDFNFAVGGGRYPADLLSKARLRSTYQALGGAFRTKGRYTIDFAFLRSKKMIAAQQHRSIKLNSDHNGVVAGYRWTSDAPSTSTTVRNDPAGTPAERDAVARTVIDAVRATPAGGTLEVVTAALNHRRTAKWLRRAVDRGVHVRVLTRSRSFTIRENGLASRIASVGDSASAVRRCERACRAAYRSSGAPRTLLMATDAEGSPPSASTSAVTCPT
ncbi:endonuclease/exonuclease/phosphatase family protein [Nocardioides sambongensis]|uniref:endonuclease/exonuclease/phosphatase family protein n=1 Tax=Nocardioides sambongensis TaxID=2589074 RepID=UPI001126FB9D|nr:endonuclease/exonuclease/phosphatase family protein [Nocardioides sambongensis]